MQKASPRELRFDSRADYRQAVEIVLASAAKQICVFDPDLKGIDFNDRQRTEALAAFLLGGSNRSLRIVLHDADSVTRDCPRLTSLLRRFSHSFFIRQTPDSLRQLADCFVLADEASAVVRFHADHYHGKLLLYLPDEVLAWHQRFEDLWLESTPALPATHLGL